MSTIKAGDTHPITLTVTSDDTPVNLTGATVRVLARPAHQASDAATVLAATVTTPLSGVLTHTLTGELTPGEWDVEVEVTRAGQVTTYPTEGYLHLTVQPDLG